MSKMFSVALLVLSVGSQSFAAEVLLKNSEITSLLNDVVLHSESNGQTVEQIFQKSGVTFYSAGGGQSQGNWHVQGDQYCSTWPPNPSWACFDVARDGNKVTFISKSGKRFEMSLIK
jgi:hypothetical protein